MKYTCIINRYLDDLNGHSIGYNVIERIVEADNRDGAIAGAMDLLAQLNNDAGKKVQWWGDQQVNPSFSLGMIVFRPEVPEETVIYDPNEWLDSL